MRLIFSVLALLVCLPDTMGASFGSPIYIDNAEFLMKGSNILSVPYGNVTDAFKAPVSINSTALDGFDWTQPYPGSRRDGHMAHLEVSREMPISASVVEDATTVLSSLTFSIPDNMSDSLGHPLAMDPSWYICRHVFISTKPEAKAAVDGGRKCDFLSQACQTDLKADLTKDWGTAADGPMCSALIFDAIPPSCGDSFGFARQDVMAFDSALLANTTLSSVQTNKEQNAYSWRIGTGYHGHGDARAYEVAANRTYLVVTVWGYSRSSKSSQTPEVSFGCLSPGASYVPPPVCAHPLPTANTTSASTSSTAPNQTPLPSSVVVED